MTGSTIAAVLQDDEQREIAQTRRRVGLKLRHARQTKGLTLKELAARSQCSESLLSKAENGRTLPSLALLHRLGRVLGINISWFVDEPEPDSSPIFRAGKRPRIKLDHAPGDWAGISFERIIPYKSGHLLQSTIHHVDVGARSGDPIAHEGEETGYVLRGRIELVLDGVAHALNPGDAFCFRSHTPHSYRNIGDEPASILWTCTPPTF